MIILKRNLWHIYAVHARLVCTVRRNGVDLPNPIHCIRRSEAFVGLSPVDDEKYLYIETIILNSAINAVLNAKSM